MNSKILFILFYIPLICLAQIPVGINYQAAVRNSKGDLLVNQLVSVQFSIILSNPNTQPVFVERHQTRTNSYGMINLVIGKGSNVLGNWYNIDWAEGAYLRFALDINGGTQFTEIATTQLLTVPYALLAEKSIKGDDWGAQAIVTSPALTGKGLDSSPLDLNSQGATMGQVLKWNGNRWMPGNDDVSGSGDKLYTSLRISGNGTISSPLDISGMGAQKDQILRWNGSAWGPSNEKQLELKAIAPLSYAGNQELKIQEGNNDKDLILWNKNNRRWEISPFPQFQQLTAGNGIEIVNNVISSTTWFQQSNNVYRNMGFVGIGTSSPLAPLDIRYNSSPDNSHLRLVELDTDFARISFYNQSNSNFWSIIARAESPNSSGIMSLYYSKNDQDIVSLTDKGIVGIGTVAPETTTKLHVVSQNKYAGLFSSNVNSDETTVINAFFDATGRVDAVAVAGTSEPQFGKGFGGQFFGGNTGILGAAYGGTFGGDYSCIGVYGEAYDDPNSRPIGTRIGVYGYGRGGEYNIGVFGSHNNRGRFNYAGLFEGLVSVRGLVDKAGGSFKIDHPLDPANKYLYHSFVESPDMLNIYNGIVQTDQSGKAIVKLPLYFEALNKTININ